MKSEYVWIIMYVDELVDPQLCLLGFIGTFSSFEKARQYAVDENATVDFARWTSRVEYRINGHNGGGRFLAAIRKTKIL